MNAVQWIDEVEAILKIQFDIQKWGAEFRPGRSEAEQIVWAAAEKNREISRAELYASDLTHLSREELRAQAERVAQGEPLAHVLGFRYFNGRRYQVSREVLTPRPETEGLLEKVFERLSNRVKTGLEIGLGSGVLSIELLLKFKELQMVATEVSPEAMQVGYSNAKKFQVELRLKTVLARLDQEVFAPLSERFDFIISNPPYLEVDDEVSALVWQTEPHLALTALANPHLPSEKNDSLYFYRAIAHQGPGFLHSDGLVALELPDPRAETVRRLFEQANWRQIEILKDLTGRPRYLFARI